MSGKAPRGGSIPAARLFFGWLTQHVEERPFKGRDKRSAPVVCPMTHSVLLNFLGGSQSHALRRGINLWPPFLGAGICVKHIAPDMKSIAVEMKLRWWNANYVGTHFGGSLFAMTDAFYMLMLMSNLGRDSIVWDKAATIRYRKPGKGTVRAEFRLTDAQLDDIREKLKTVEKYEPTFSGVVRDEPGTVIADVEKLLYIRRKAAAPIQTETAVPVASRGTRNRHDLSRALPARLRQRPASALA